ncbi:hypothetical protein BGZ94_008956 [Podila epigama]|nr:hypothetical protein BGZ94_008956 [Podila epigama]
MSSSSSSSTTHNVVRVVQLCLSISLVATAAFLLHYRTKAHANFTNEPLASCITGAVAFIYALWALLNHRRQPEKHQWIYLHGLACIVVCGLLIAGATLAIILGNQGVLCDRLQDAHDLDDPGSSNLLQNESRKANLTMQAGHPEFHEDQPYAPGQVCENIYSEMDRACAVLGIMAALFWVADFCLIFGFCGSNGRYSAYRRRHRGQVGPREGNVGDMDEEQRDDRGGYGFDPQEDYYDTLDGRKRNLEWIEHRTREDPQRHVQGPIPLSMQSNYHAGSNSTRTAASTLNLSTLGQSNNDTPVVVTVTASTPGDDLKQEPTYGLYQQQQQKDQQQQQEQQQDQSSLDHHTTPVLSLNPPPRTQWRPQPTPDSPTIPQHMSIEATLERDHSDSQEEGGLKPSPVRLPSDIADTLSPKAVPQLPIHNQHTACSAQEQEGAVVEAKSHLTATPVAASTPTTSLAFTPAQITTTDPTNDSTTTTMMSESAKPSPRYIEYYPPGPACYVFDACNQEYLPTFVNQAARNEMHQQLQHKEPKSGRDRSPARALTPSSTTQSPSRVCPQKVYVTGLGLEVISRSDAEIAAADEAAIKEQETFQQQLQQQDDRAATPVMTPGMEAVDRLKTGALPSNAVESPRQPQGPSSTSYFPSAPSSPLSLTSESADTMFAPVVASNTQGPNDKISLEVGSNTSQLEQPQYMNKGKPLRTKHKTKLSVETRLDDQGGQSSASLSEMHATPRSLSPPRTESPRSMYAGDF